MVALQTDGSPALAALVASTASAASAFPRSRIVRAFCLRSRKKSVSTICYFLRTRKYALEIPASSQRAIRGWSYRQSTGGFYIST